MLPALRRKLTISFVCISLLIYCLTGLVAAVFFATGLNANVDSNINRLISDIQPSVELEQGELTLKQWAENARKQHLNILHTVQLYDSKGNLREEYGPPGVRRLYNGDLKGFGLRFEHHFKSNFAPVFGRGYLQIQKETKQADDALKQFVLTAILVIPILALATGLCGYAFAGKAVEPVARSVAVLRQFVADAGHELNTPTTIIEAGLQTLDEELTERQMDTEVVRVIARASQRMRNLAANLVLLARMESPELDLPKSRLKVDLLAEQVTEDFEEIARNRDINLNCEGHSSATISANTDSLQRLLANLIDNALRYTDPGGTVTVTVSRKDMTATIAVSDTGTGISAENLERIFDRFYRIDKSRSRAQGGNGLGLSIVKAIADAHQFTIKVQSVLNEGSKFSINMPCQVEPPKPEGQKAQLSASSQQP